MLKIICVICMVTFLSSFQVLYGQQYSVHSWESFESGTVPDTMVRFHHSSEETVGAINLRSPDMPENAKVGPAAIECGQYALAFKPTAKAMHLSVFTPDTLNRDRLGQQGRALYQADFYLPPEGTSYPNTSLLAQVITDGSDKYRFYRFGVSKNGTKAFFSFANNTGKPLIYKQQSLSEFELKRPGWHRFQIIFQGPTQIHCAIDGQTTSFSPISEGTHRRINAGVMVASADQLHGCVVDNLSIQWTPDQAPLPVSPWTVVPENASVPNKSPLESGKSVFWLNDHAKAWDMVQRQKRPLLVMFYSPNIDPYQYTKSIIPNNEEAYALFNKYVLLKFDANQLKGGKMADRFRVNRLPTFIELDPESAREIKRFVVRNQETTWEDVKVVF